MNFLHAVQLQRISMEKLGFHKQRNILVNQLHQITIQTMATIILSLLSSLLHSYIHLVSHDKFHSTQIVESLAYLLLTTDAHKTTAKNNLQLNFKQGSLFKNCVFTIQVATSKIFISLSYHFPSNFAHSISIISSPLLHLHLQLLHIFSTIQNRKRLD